MCKTPFLPTDLESSRADDRASVARVMDAAPRPALGHGRVAGAGLVGALAVVLAAAVFDGGGATDDSLATVGGAAILGAALGTALALRGRLPLPRLDPAGVVVVLGATALTAWAGVSIAWSIAGDRSWEWLDRGLVYLAFLALGMLAGATVDGARRVTMLLAAVIGAALFWALLGVAVPRFFEDGDRIARLREPVGYWNGLAVLADAALVLGLCAARDGRLVARLAGALLTYTGTVAILLTQSRAGVVAGAVVVALWLLLTDERLQEALRASLFIGPGLVVGGWAFTRPALVEDGALRADRVADGRWFAVFAVAGALLVATAALGVPVARLVAEHGSRVRQAIIRLTAIGALAGALALVAAVGNPISWASSQFSGGECSNAPGRLTELCANNRLAWWDEALDVAVDRPLGGSGAGTFELARRRYREDATQVNEPHSVPLQVLADTGAVGLALLLLFAVAAVGGVRRTLRHGNGTPLAALTCVAVAYAVHALVDYDLDLLAVTAPALVALGTLLATGKGGSERRAGVAGLLALAAVAAAAVVSLVLPELAERNASRAVTSADAGRVQEAVEAADRARRLDPLSVEPLHARAIAADAAGDEAAAVAWYEEATRLQPENPDTWYELGLYHAIATGDQCAAYQALNASYTLDPKSRRWSPGGILDVARDAVNDGACE
jgi:O-antigen ligase